MGESSVLHPLMNGFDAIGYAVPNAAMGQSTFERLPLVLLESLQGFRGHANVMHFVGCLQNAIRLNDLDDDLLLFLALLADRGVSCP